MPAHPYFPLACPNAQGSLLLTPCPGTKAVDIPSALNELKAAGATAVVTLMTGPEMQKNHVETLAQQCAQLGLEWFHFPVEDEGAPPEGTEIWDRARADLHQRLDNREAIAIHCKGGSGRTGVVAAQILMERGVPMQEAMEQIKVLRPNAFAHQVQVDYMARLAGSITVHQSNL